MIKNECAVCSAEAPDDYWAEGWTCVTASGLVLSLEAVSGVPAHVVVAPRAGSCLVCGESCLQLLVWREYGGRREERAARF